MFSAALILPQNHTIADQGNWEKPNTKGT